MFGLIAKLRGAKRGSHRDIFRYFDGMQDRAVDPMAVFRSLSSHPEFDINQSLPQIASGDLKLQMESSAIAVDATRKAFGIQPWDEFTGTGLTELETLDVLLAFGEFTNGLKKNGSG